MWVNPRQLEVKIPALDPHEGATVEMAYPADILDQNGLENVKAYIYGLGSWIIFIGQHWLDFYFIFVRYIRSISGFEDKRSIAVQYEAPKGLSLLQSGLVS